MKQTKQLTDEQELYLKKVMRRLEEGGLPKQTTKETLKALNDLRGEIINPFKVLGVLNKYIPKKLLQEHYAEPTFNPEGGKREVILSMYLTGE